MSETKKTTIQNRTHNGEPVDLLDKPKLLQLSVNGSSPHIDDRPPPSRRPIETDTG